jgi:hypothetical protein
MTKILLMITYVSYFKTNITTVLLKLNTAKLSLNTAKLSLNTTETQLSHEIFMIKVLIIMTYIPHLKSITFTKTISHKILLNYY